LFVERLLVVLRLEDLPEIPKLLEVNRFATDVGGALPTPRTFPKMDVEADCDEPSPVLAEP